MPYCDPQLGVGHREGETLRAFLALLFVFFAARAEADYVTRVTFVVGNANYRHLSSLKNPINDAALIRRTLVSFGYEVISITDASTDDFYRGFESFMAKVKTTPPLVVIYFAGHGVQVEGDNYLLPVDANVSSAAEIKVRAHNVTKIVQSLAEKEASHQTVLVILDACSNNPFSPDLEIGTSRGLAAIHFDKDAGSARSENYNLERKVPHGMIVAMASDPGTTASDGKGKNSPFVEAFVRAINDAAIPDIRAMLGETRLEVRRSTNGRQSSWIFGGLPPGNIDMGFRRDLPKR